MPKILRVAVPVPLRSSFDYLLPENFCSAGHIQPGARVAVPFGNQIKIGYVLEISDFSEIPVSRLKNAKAIIDEESFLSPIDLDFLVWAGRYYHHPVGEVISSAFPVPLRNGKPARITGEKFLFPSREGAAVSENQLKRAPRQSELMRLINSSAKGVSENTLNKLDWNWRGFAKQLVRKGLIEIREVPRILCSNQSPKPANLSLNTYQKAAVETIRKHAGGFASFLLEGVTGSGKTEVYLRLIESIVKLGKQVMVLLPEISLTPQLEARFRERLAYPIVLFHSGLNPNQRLQSWLCFQQGLAPILLGTRSAVFNPMSNPGLIILDEEHDTSFKQQEGFRFSARDIAIARAKKLHIPVLLGSATPSLESVFNAEHGRYRRLQLPERAGKALPPQIKLLDIRNQPMKEGLSPQMLNEIKTVLSNHEQVLLFLNRRGFAPTLTCHVCGWVASCSRCNTHLVVHVGDARLRCHHCGAEKPMIKGCQHCRAQELRPLGLGTERVETALKRFFPDANITRIDRDTTRKKGSLESYLKQVTERKVDILLGTQMLAKGHHFPGVTLVGILDVDSGLYSVDFRAPERMAQLIVQVAGRAGREHKPGKVLLQTRHPHEPLLFSLIHKGYRMFSENALKERKTAGLPPSSYQALIRANSTNQQMPFRFLEKVRTTAMDSKFKNVDCFGPVTAPLPKKAGFYRFQLLLQSLDRERLHSLVDELLPRISDFKETKRVRWSLDVDPVDLY